MFLKKKKGVISLFTGIAVLLVSIVFLGIFTYFAMGYFGNLEDSQRMKANRNNLSLINQQLIDIKTEGIGSYNTITIDNKDPITINHVDKKIILTQEIKNQKSIEKLKDESIIGNLKIEKKETRLLYSIDYNGIINFYETIDIIPGKHKIIFEKLNEVNNLSLVSVRYEEIKLEKPKIYSPVENYNYTFGQPILLKGMVTNTLEEYICKWESSVDGLLTENCEQNVENLSQGTHQITFSAIKGQEIIASKKMTIIIGTGIYVPIFSINILSPENNIEKNLGEEFIFTSQIINPVATPSCSWTSSINGNISNDCNFSTSSLSAGNHTITLSVNDTNQTLQQTRNITVNIGYLEATGGTITTSGDYRYHTFTTNGTFNITTLGNGKVDVLVIGGGGGAGRGGTNTARNAGGGGAGGVVYIENYDVNLGSIGIGIGAGGAGSTNTGVVGTNGSNSNFGSLNAVGGGGGGSMGGADSTTNAQRAGANGGSGGGGGVYGTTLLGTAGSTTQSSQSGLSGTFGIGFNGIQATSSTAGGGGGAGGASTGTAGGPGISIWGTTYAVGGSAHSNAAAGTANTGNGGNAAATNLGSNGGNGGSGIVVVRYKFQN